MGQKVSPVGLRVGVNRNWDSRWYANDQDFAGLLHEDIKVRDYILKKLKCRKALCFKAFRHFIFLRVIRIITAIIQKVL